MKKCYYTSYKSPLGTIFIGSIDKLSISFLNFIKKDYEENIKENIKKILKNKYIAIKEKLPVLEYTKNELNSYFKGKKIISPDTKIEYASQFERKVWEETKKIPYGNTASYKQIAQNINIPKSARAVGNALGKNPIAIIIPCHRIIKINGEYGNYAYGKPIKTKLIQLEQKYY